MWQQNSSTTDIASPVRPEARQPASPPSRKRWLRPWMLWAVVILLAGAAFILYRHGEKVAQAKTGRTAQSPSIRVVAAQAHKGNIDVYVNGLGTVVPIYTITVTSRVD